MMGEGYRGQGSRRKAKKPGPDGVYPLVPKLHSGSRTGYLPRSKRLTDAEIAIVIETLGTGLQTPSRLGRRIPPLPFGEYLLVPDAGRGIYPVRNV